MKKFLLGFVILLLTVNLVLIITGKSYLYKGVANTYLKGRSGPTIDEYRIFDNRTIEAENPQAWPKHIAYNNWQMHPATDAEMKNYETVAFVVISGDSLLYENYWEYFNETTISNSFSMAKTIVSILTGIALKEGKIKSIDDPVGDYIPEFKQGEKSKITIRHLLTMSSGINYDESYGSPFAYPAAAYYGKNLRNLTLKYKPATEPGKILDYQSGTTQLLGLVVTEATGMSLSEYAQEKLWKPIGATEDALWNLDKKDGVEKAFCCFIATARDFARLGKLYKDHGKWNGYQIIDSSYVAESLTPAPLTEKNGQAQNRYGFKWWIMQYKGMNTFYARGILGQYIWVIPELDLVVVRLGRKRAENQGDNHPADMNVYLDEALKIRESAVQ